MNNAVEHPKHYRLEGINEVLDVIRYALSEEEYLGFLKGNVIKYVLRAPYKGELEQDWEKASYYANLVKKSSDRTSDEEKPNEEDFETEEEETSEYRDMDVKTLMGIVSEDSDITTVLEVLEGYMTKQDLKEVLVEIAEKM